MFKEDHSFEENTYILMLVWFRIQRKIWYWEEVLHHIVNKTHPSFVYLQFADTVPVLADNPAVFAGTHVVFAADTVAVLADNQVTLDDNHIVADWLSFYCV